MGELSELMANVEWLGTDFDIPEGSRYCQVSEKLWRQMQKEAAELEEASSQESNKRLCSCAYESEMMGKVPEGSFCPFCGWRRYESVVTEIAQLKKSLREARK